MEASDRYELLGRFRDEVHSTTLEDVEIDLRKVWQFPRAFPSYLESEYAASSSSGSGYMMSASAPAPPSTPSAPKLKANGSPFRSS